MTKMICLKGRDGGCDICNDPILGCRYAKPHEHDDVCDLASGYCPKCESVEEE